MSQGIGKTLSIERKMKKHLEKARKYAKMNAEYEIIDEINKLLRLPREK